MLTRGRLRVYISPFVRKLRGIAQIHRLSILHVLLRGPLETHVIVHHLGIAENLASHHLRQMHLSGWLIKKKVGREVIYRINEKALESLKHIFENS